MTAYRPFCTVGKLRALMRHCWLPFSFLREADAVNPLSGGPYIDANAAGGRRRCGCRKRSTTTAAPAATDHHAHRGDPCRNASRRGVADDGEIAVAAAGGRRRRRRSRSRDGTRRTKQEQKPRGFICVDGILGGIPGGGKQDVFNII